MTDSEPASRRVAIAGLVTLTVVAAVGYVLFTGGESGQLAAGGVVMVGAVVLGLIEAFRSRTRVGLVGGAALVAGGGYGTYLAAAGRDPFTNNAVLGFLVVGLVSGLFVPNTDADPEPDPNPDPDPEPEAEPGPEPDGDLDPDS